MRHIPVIGKFLVILCAFGLFVAAVTAYSSSRISFIDTSYTALLEKESNATLMLARASRSLVSIRSAIADILIARDDADKKAAGEKYGVATSVGPVIPVKFTGVAGEHKANYNTVTVEGLPAELSVRVQTGPALNGTDLRDATGQIEFGQFKNQIEYQDAGSAINNEVKKVVLAGIDPAALNGKTVTVIGAFKLVNPKNWIVTPVRLDVK